MIALVRPYLKPTACHYGRIVVSEARDVTDALANLNGGWLADAVLAAASTRLYEAWETNIRAYLKNQRVWNGLHDDFDWTIGDTDVATRVETYLHCFGVTTASTKKIREIGKTSALCIEQYEQACETITMFWHIVASYETFRLETYP